MGLLEYLPCVTQLMTVFFVQLVIEQPQTVKGNWWSVMAGGMDRPSCTKSHPAASLSSSQSRGPPCWAGPLAFGLIGDNSSSPRSLSLDLTSLCKAGTFSRAGVAGYMIAKIHVIGSFHCSMLIIRQRIPHTSQIQYFLLCSLTNVRISFTY
jgi:hypothetical protein